MSLCRCCHQRIFAKKAPRRPLTSLLPSQPSPVQHHSLYHAQPTRIRPLHMSGALIDFVEARLDLMNGVNVRSEPEVRQLAPPPITPNSIRKQLRERHLRPIDRTSKITDSIHESFSWLEEYVDVKLEMMKKRDSLTSTLSSFSLTDSFDDDSCRGHHRRSLSRRDSLSVEIKNHAEKSHKRTHSRRESLLIGLELDLLMQNEDKQGEPEAALAA